MNWEIRQQILERDGYVCQSCGKIGNEVHHKIAIRKGGLDTLDNLILLCKPCHKTIEPSRKMGYAAKVNLNMMTIKVSDANHKALAQFGAWGESMDSIIGKLIKHCKECHISK